MSEEPNGIHSPYTDSPQRFRLGAWLVWPARGLIARGGPSTHLEPKMMEVLVQLARNAGKVVSHDELLDAVWPGSFIQSEALFRHVSLLRRALGDNARHPSYIETIPKRGYRLIAEVAWDEPMDPDRPIPAPTKTRLHGPPRWAFPFLAAVVVLTPALAALRILREPPLPDSGEPSPGGSIPVAVAVLPLDGSGLEPETDALRIAVADEITTLLSHASALRVRPFSLTRRHALEALSPQAVGREVDAGVVIAGQIAHDGGKVRISLEAIDVDHNSIVWRKSVRVEPSQWLTLGELLESTVRESLLPALGLVPPASSRPLPQDATAYRLFLESLAAPRNPEPNRKAIQALQEAVDRDPGYAPAWASLAERLYLESAYGSLQESTADAALEASRRATELDPDLVLPGVVRVGLLTESSRLTEAYEVARELVLRQPLRAESHFAEAYVLRYAGLLEEAAERCNAALSLSPSNYRLRSCAQVFYRLGRFDRALDFIRLDAGSRWAILHRGFLALHRGQPETARKIWHDLPETSPLFGFLDACLDRPDAPDTARRLTEAQAQWTRDSEAWYLAALVIHTCGLDRAALQMLRTATRRNFCALSAFEPESAFSSLRALEGWSEAREEAAVCRDNFLEHRRPDPHVAQSPP